MSVDVETSGLDRRADELLEIGAAVVDLAGGVLAEFSAMIDRPCGGFDEEALAINGYRERIELARADGLAMTPEDARRAFQEFTEGVLRRWPETKLVGWNVGFDLDFIDRFMGGGDGPRWSDRFGWHHLDAKAVARAFADIGPLPDGYRGSALADVAASLGVDPGRSHRALDDARTAVAVYARLLEEIKGGFVPVPALRAA